MAEGFNLDEVFAMAEQMERNGAAFYRKAAGYAREDARRLLLDLAAMEEDHQSTFADMRHQFAGKQQETLIDPQGEAAAYLDALMYGMVFDRDERGSEELGHDASLEKVLRHAIDMEKETIAFYKGIREVMGVELGADRIHAILMEEMSHVVQLTERLRSLASEDADA